MMRRMMMAVAGVWGVGAFGWTLEARRETTSGENLRGFGRCSVAYETWAGAEGKVNVMRFGCAKGENAETVAGKYLWDLSWSEGMKCEDGVWVGAGGKGYAAGKSGARAAIYTAESAAALKAYFRAKPGEAETLRSEAKCPEWMKRFEWGTYGMGGLEDHHDWMRRGGAKGNEQLDPREDFAFLKEMGPMHFDNWLQLEGMDNCDGLTQSMGSIWKARYAEEIGVPYATRFYMPCEGWAWVNRRFSEYMEKPAEFTLNGWLRYGSDYMPHISWYNADIWGYMAARTKRLMEEFKTDKLMGWMHPAGELVHQPWYDMHSDYTPGAKADWHAYLKRHGVTLGEASEMYSRGADKFVSWDQVEVPEFATFAGLPGKVLDLAGMWFASSNGVEWTALEMPGNREYLEYFKPYTQDRQRNLKRLMKRNFEWDASLAGGKKAYLYFFPMSRVNARHLMKLNGEEIAKAGTWCALDVTEKLKQGTNTLELEMQGYVWNGRIFISTQEPAVYPNLGEARNRMFALWNDWRRDAKMRRCEEVFDAMRQADPNAPIKFMAPLSFGTPITDRLMVEWGAHPHFTGEGTWFFPWYKRYGKLWGYQGTSELAGPYKTLEQAKQSILRVFLAGLDLHQPVFLTQTYSRNKEVREWWLKHKAVIRRLGRQDIWGPQVLLYRRSLAGLDDFPAPEPLIGVKGHMVQTPWDWDIGRGTLQSIGQSMLYIDDDGVEAGKMYDHKIMVDCGNEVADPQVLEKIGEWVKEGGTFVAFPFTGRSTTTKGDSWPIAELAGARVKKLRELGGKVKWEGREVADNGRTVNCEGNNLNYYSVELEPVEGAGTEVMAEYENGAAAVTARKLGKGKVVWLGSAFWRDSEDVMGIWWPKKGESEFWKGLLAKLGAEDAVCGTEDPLTWAQPYRSNDGADLVTVLCNFNTGGVQKVKGMARTARKPTRVVAYGEDGTTHPKFTWKDGVCEYETEVTSQDVKVVHVCDAFAPEDAAGYWWKENQIAWRELKASTRDFSKYFEGKWKDPTQDLKRGWKMADGKECAADVLQFWGLPDGAEATITKRFDVENKDWFKGGVVRLVCGTWRGPNFLSPAKITLNGETVVEKAGRGLFLDIDATRLLKPEGNEMKIEFGKPYGGHKFTGLNGSIWLYHRAHAAKSMEIAGLPHKFAAPKEWEGKYKVFLYIEAKDGKAKPPLGAKVRDRFSRKHHHNFGTITDVDITAILKFGEDNVLTPVGRAPRGGWDWSKFKTRIELFELKAE